MSAASQFGSALLTAQDTFLAQLPRIENVLQFQLRHWPTPGRDVAIADARAAAWHAWVGLVRRGK